MSKDDVFGSPEARDASAYLESIIEESATYLKDIVKQSSQTVLNRQLGSKKVPLRDRVAEYQMAREDPAWLAQYFVDSGATLEEMIQHAEELEREILKR